MQKSRRTDPAADEYNQNMGDSFGKVEKYWEKDSHANEAWVTLKTFQLVHGCNRYT